MGPVGPQGPAGDFTGVFTSPNGDYSISVTDAGIVLAGPNNASIAIANGSVTINGMQVMIDSDGTTTIDSDGTTTISSSTTTRVNGTSVVLNCTSGGQPVARVGDQYSGTGGQGFSSGTITTGSLTVRAC